MNKKLNKYLQSFGIFIYIYPSLIFVKCLSKLYSFLAFFSRSLVTVGFHLAMSLVNTNFKDTRHSFYRSGALSKFIVLDRVFNKNPLFLSLNCIEMSGVAISLDTKLKNHPQRYSG